MRNYLPMLFLFSLSIFFTGNFDYDKAWKKVDSLLQSGLPESAAEKIEEIYSMASKENNVPQQIKATVYLAQVTFDHEELGLENVITDLEEKIENTPSPGKEVMTSILAEVISSYYQNQSYIISQRTNLEERSKDIRTWTPVNFNEYIHELYWKSIDEKTKAYETKDIAVIDPALEKINEAWKVASEEMYKAQQEAQAGGAAGPEANAGDAQSEGDNVEDVDFEEVK